MASLDPTWATRFYGMTVTRELAARCHEQLTRRDDPDLVSAHLRANYAYFGAIDKTLSGFVVLDDTNDDFTLYDLRGDRGTYFQDHQLRAVRQRADGERGGRARTPTTAALAKRYQWLVWWFAQPQIHGGAHVLSAEELVRKAIGLFRATWPTRAVCDAAFAMEVPSLAGDPHLAIYWLLHATALVDDGLRSAVVAAIGGRSAELVRSFVARFGPLALAADVAAVPEFRARRAHAVAYGGFALEGDDVARACLRALEISPSTRSLTHALSVVGALTSGGLDPALVKAALDRIPEVTPGTELVRAVLDRRGGATASGHADALAVAVPMSDETWWLALEALWLVHELAYDAKALVNATRALVSADRYNRRGLQMAMRAAQMAGMPVDGIEADIAVADALIAPFQRLIEKPAEISAAVDGLDAATRSALARRVLQRVALNKPTPELLAWAASEVGDAELVSQTAVMLDLPALEALGPVVAAQIDRADHPLIDVVLAAVDGPEPATTAGLQDLAFAKKSLWAALAPWLPAPTVFSRVMDLVERTAGSTCISSLFDTLFDPFDANLCVVPRLDTAQAIRAARAMISTVLHHPRMQARGSAGHHLFGFAHPGAADFLIDALTEYGVRYAAQKEPGPTFDYGKSFVDQLEDVVANLYAAVSEIDSPIARAALVERLFAERRAYWRMGNAIGRLWNPALHAQVMALLAERRDARAAGAYAYTLVAFVAEPGTGALLELTRLVLEWQGDTEIARGFLHYALVVGQVAALDAGDVELLRRAHEAAAWISERPIEPDAHAKGQRWTNPLESDEIATAIQRLLGPATDVARTPVKPRSPTPTPTPKPRSPTPNRKPKPKPKPTPNRKPKPKPKPKLKPKPKAKATPKPKRKKR